MTERLNIPERGERSNESLDSARRERAAELERTREREAERAPERSVEQSIAEAKEAAAKAEKKTGAPAPIERRRDTPAQRRSKAKASYKATMKETQAHMKPAARTFSKVIHAPAVEKTSEAIGSTLARPNAILAGSLTAFIATLVIYLTAKYYGYPLSGFETIAAFIVGWAVGILIDYLRVMVTGKKA